MMTAVIIDDEERSRIVLRNLLNVYCPEVTIVGMADGVLSAVELITAQNPEIVFLDVQINGGTGFDVLEQLEDIDGGVIFTTAYDQYALKAFKFSAVDYLLKPIDIEELRTAVRKISHARENQAHRQQIRNLLSHYRNPDDEPVLIVTVPEALEQVHTRNIVRCVARDEVTEIYMSNGSVMTLDKPISEVEFLLQDYGFFRIHPEHIVNLKEVRKLSRSGSGVILYNGMELPLSTSRQQAFHQLRNRSLTG